jgi:hypothetical protein
MCIAASTSGTWARTPAGWSRANATATALTPAGAGGFVPYLGFGLIVPATYAAGVSAVAVAFARDQPAGVRAQVPLVLAAMHMSWGAGYLTSPRRLARRQ